MINLEPGFPSKVKAAEADQRYVHRYNYSTEHNGWILITAASRMFGENRWVFRLVDPKFGQPVGEPITTSADLWVDRFADRPFDLEEPVEDQYAWFLRIARSVTSSQTRLDKMFEGYRERLSYCSSYEALRRVGAITTPAALTSPRVRAWDNFLENNHGN